jgi:hypothetical protein
MNDLKRLALELAAASVIAEAAKDAKDRLRAEFYDAMANTGADAVKAKLGDEDIAKCVLIEPEAKATVFNEDAFAQFVESIEPHSIVSRVREQAQIRILADIEEHDGQAIHKPTGQIVEGIQFVSRIPFVQTKFTSEGKERLIEAFRSNQIATKDILKEIE